MRPIDKLISGLAVEHTGGGYYALIAATRDGLSILVTDDDGQLPSSVGPWCIGVYDSTEEAPIDWCETDDAEEAAAYLAAALGDGVSTISIGVVCLSVCADRALGLAVVEAIANARHPTGLASCRWSVEGVEQYADGTPVGSECPQSARRRHWLLEC